MSGYVLAAAASLVVAILVGWALPAWAVKRLAPSFERDGRLVTNYRGRRIPAGLGVAWLAWAAGAGAMQAVVHGITLDPFSSAPLSALGWASEVAYDTMLLLPPLLVAGAFAFGTIDDVLGSHEVKGFRGHVREMMAGRLTTGGLKLVGIGLLALAAGGSVYAVRSATSDIAVQGAPDLIGVLRVVAAWACASGVIALSANFVNLTDLRPGRALKTYCIMALLGLITIASRSVSLLLGSGAAAQTYAAAGVLGPYMAWISMAARLTLLAVLVFGPIVAVWRLDLGERGMLGDAGANAMGALAGFLLVARAPLWLEAVLLVILLALNLSSERVSFSSVIERVAFLRWLDSLGRGVATGVTEMVEDGDDGIRAGGPGVDGDDARRDGGA